MYYDIYVLSSLMNSPRHGYDIKKNLIDKFSACKNMSNNTLYPVLKKFEKDGYITKKVEIQEGKPNKFIYYITDAGKKYFIKRLYDYPSSLSDDREEFSIRMAYFHLLNFETRKKILDLRINFLKSALSISKKIENEEHCIFDAKVERLKKYQEDILNLDLKLAENFYNKINEPCLTPKELLPK